MSGRAQIAFALGSADAVDRLTDRLTAAGHPVIEPPHHSGEGHYHATVLDPGGNRIELTVYRHGRLRRDGRLRAERGV